MGELEGGVDGVTEVLHVCGAFVRPIGRGGVKGVAFELATGDALDPGTVDARE